MTRRVGLFVALLGALLLAPGSAAEPNAVSAGSARRGAAYLAEQQGDDGSVPAGWGVSGVADAVVALLAGGGQTDAVDDALGYISDNAAEFLADDDTQGPHVARVVSGLVAAGEDPRGFAGFDWVAEVEAGYDPDTRSYGGNVFGDSLAMLGLLAADEELPDGAVTRLRANQCATGGWGWQHGCGSLPDTDTTALAMSVLVTVAGAEDLAVDRGREWLLDAQTESGCWGFSASFPDENANSCGLALSAVVAVGEDPKDAPWTSDGRDPLGRLRDFQRDSGGFCYLLSENCSVNDYATIQAVPAMAHWSYPVSPPTDDDGGNPAPGGTSTTSSTSPTTSTASTQVGASADDATSTTTSTSTSIPRVRSSPFARSQVAGTVEVPEAGTTTTARSDREPGAAVATATYPGEGSGGDGVGGLATGMAFGSLGSAALGVGWYWRRRIVPGLLVD